MLISLPENGKPGLAADSVIFKQSRVRILVIRVF